MVIDSDSFNPCLIRLIRVQSDAQWNTENTD